jgi:phospholipase C
VSVLPQIETIVVLMVENRSLDTMLGWLHEGDKNIKIVPQGSQPDRFDGIVPGMSNSAYSDTYAPRRGSPGLGSQRWRVPREDPAESMRNVADQMYADGSGDRQGRTWADNAPMTGFAWDYLRMFPPSLSDVMGAYTADELPILYGLAERFAVSDRWFSSVPTETAPNRDFAFCGTSEGKETDLDPPFSVSAPTIFSALNDLDTSWAIYARADFGGPPFTNSGITYSELHFDGVRSAIADPQSRDAMLPYEDLLDRLKSGGELPSFCWVEPAWGWGLGDADGFVGWQGNDYHPPTWVGPAERGIDVDHVTIYRWVQRFTPLVIDAARPFRHSVGDRWFVDETYVRVAGVWRYVYRAVDQHGQVIDVNVSKRRNLVAATRFFEIMLSVRDRPKGSHH